MYVADILNLDLIRVGFNTWQMKDPNNPKEPSSLTVFEKTNSFYRFSGKDFGGVTGGSPIDLVMHVRDCNLMEAVDFLLSYFPQ